MKKSVLLMVFLAVLGATGWLAMKEFSVPAEMQETAVSSGVITGGTEQAAP
jgi:hypothetical protein